MSPRSSDPPRGRRAAARTEIRSATPVRPRPAQAAKNPDGSPQSNAARNIWVTETALTTALYTSYFGENVALFAIIVGIALLLVGIGFVVLIVVARRTAPATAPATQAPPDTAPAT